MDLPGVEPSCTELEGHLGEPEDTTRHDVLHEYPPLEHGVTTPLLSRVTPPSP